MISDMGVSENSVPLNPMVLLIIIPFLNGYFIGNINPTFSDKPTWFSEGIFGCHVFPGTNKGEELVVSSKPRGPRTMTISSGWNKGPIPQATTSAGVQATPGCHQTWLSKPCWMTPESKPCIPAIFHYIPITFTSYIAQSIPFTITRSHVVSSLMISSCFAAILDEFEMENLRKSRFYSQNWPWNI